MVLTPILCNCMLAGDGDRNHTTLDVTSRRSNQLNYPRKEVVSKNMGATGFEPMTTYV